MQHSTNGPTPTLVKHASTMTLSPKPTDVKMLRLIAAFKFLKVALLIAAGVGAFKLLHRDMGLVAQHWMDTLGLDPGNRLVDAALQKAADLTPHKVKFLGACSFIYAGLFATEGTGLWLAKRWGEWITVVITGSLVPVEIYEIAQHASAMKIAMLVINIAVVVYLIYRIRTERQA